MAWIEGLFGVSPDGGDGTLELTLVALAVCTVVALWMLRSARTRRRTST